MESVIRNIVSLNSNCQGIWDLLKLLLSDQGRPEGNVYLDNLIEMFQEHNIEMQCPLKIMAESIDYCIINGSLPSANNCNMIESIPEYDSQYCC